MFLPSVYLYIIKAMRKTFLFLLIVNFNLLQAQKKTILRDRISIRFTMENVFAISRYSNFGTNYKPINNSGYYEFKKMTFVPPSGFTPLTLGVLINYQMNNGWRCMLGVSQDGAYYGYSISLRRMDVYAGRDTIYNEQHISSAQGVANIKFPLLFYKTIFNTDSIRDVHKHAYGAIIDLLVGINYIYQPGRHSDVLIDDGYDSIPMASGKYLSYSSKLYAGGGWGAAWDIGFNCDIKHKQKNLFSLCVYYKQGVNWGYPGSLFQDIFRAIKIHPQSIWAWDHTVVTIDGKKYSHDIYSQGSGIYIQLSKDLSFTKRKKKTIHV
jgi:hypothetical protein